MPKISFNGQEYESLEAMPPDIRKLYALMAGVFADQDGNGVPDLLEGATRGQQGKPVTQFVVDGKAYSRLEELPPELRERYTAAMAKLDANKNNIPDLLEGNIFATITNSIQQGSSAPTVTTGTQQTPAAPSATSVPAVQVIGDRPSPGMMRMIVIGLIILAVVAIAVYLFGSVLSR